MVSSVSDNDTTSNETTSRNHITQVGLKSEDKLMQVSTSITQNQTTSPKIPIVNVTLNETPDSQFVVLSQKRNNLV